MFYLSNAPLITEKGGSFSPFHFLQILRYIQKSVLRPIMTIQYYSW